jgi:hypothetical protein
MSTVDTLEPIIEHHTDVRVAAAAAGLRPPAPYVVGSLVRFATWRPTYKVDARGEGTYVYLYGPGERGHSVLVRASGFYPYLYVELGQLDPRALVNEVNATILQSLAVQSKQWAPERRASALGIVGSLRRYKGNTIHRAPQRQSRFMPVVGYEVVPASIARGFGGDFGYRGIEPRAMLKIYFYSPAMLVRGRDLLLGRHAHATPQEQARLLAEPRVRKEDAAVAAEGERKFKSMRDFIKDVDEMHDNDAVQEIDAGMPDDAEELYREVDEALDEQEFDEPPSTLGAEWINADGSDSDDEPQITLAHPAADYEELERRLETQFCKTARDLLACVRPSRAASLLSALNEDRPLKVCDADLDFVLRFCTDVGIAPCAWAEVNTAASRLVPSVCRDERAGRVHSADGQHGGFPDATWMLDRAPPGVEPRETRVLRVLHAEDAESFCQLEIRCNFHHLSAVVDERMSQNVPEPLTLSYDIETETGPNMAFSKPDAQRVFDVGIVVPYASWHAASATKRWRNVVFALGTMTRTKAPADADEFVLCFDDERELLLSVYRFVALVRPDEVVTFNGHDFDFRYLEGRSMALHIADEFAQCWPKIKRHGRLSIRPRHFQSKAHGVHETFEVDAEGMVSIDVYLMVKRNVGIKLKSNGLDSLSAHFLGDHKEKMSPADINPKQRTADGRAELKTYVLKDAKLPLLLIQKQRWLLGFIEKSRLVGCTLNMQLERGMNIQVSARPELTTASHNRAGQIVRLPLEPARHQDPRGGGRHWHPRRRPVSTRRQLHTHRPRPRARARPLRRRHRARPDDRRLRHGRRDV